MGVLGVAVPAAMPLLKSAEILARTGSPSQAGDEIKKDYTNLLGGGGIGGFSRECHIEHDLYAWRDWDI